jgi:hypothetical protein
MRRSPLTGVGLVLLLGGAVCNAQPNNRLFSKIYGCEAAVTVGNAMGVPIEGWTWEKIEKTYGFLDKFVPELRPHEVPHSLHTDELFLAEYGRAVLSRSHTQSAEAWGVPRCRRVDPGHRRIRRSPQSEAQTLHLDRVRQ